MAEKPELHVVEDEPPFNGLMPPDELQWWQKQLGKPVEALGAGAGASLSRAVVGSTC